MHRLRRLALRRRRRRKAAAAGAARFPRAATPPRQTHAQIASGPRHHQAVESGTSTGTLTSSQQCLRPVSDGQIAIRRKAPITYATRHTASFQPSHALFTSPLIEQWAGSVGYLRTVGRPHTNLVGS